MRQLFPAHHRKGAVLLLKSARIDLDRRGIDHTGMTALEIFSLRATERSKDRLRALAAKLERARRQRPPKTDPLESDPVREDLDSGAGTSEA